MVLLLLTMLETVYPLHSSMNRYLEGTGSAKMKEKYNHIFFFVSVFYYIGDIFGEMKNKVYEEDKQ